MSKAKYETLVVFCVKDGEEAVNALVEKFRLMVETDAVLDSVDVWGNRRLAYPIDYETEGHYVLFNYQAESDFPAELDRVLKITDGILRWLTVKKD